MAEEKCLEAPKTFEELTRGIRKLFQDDNINVEEVQSFMESYKSNPSEWSSFAMFDPHRYTRNLVDEGNGKYNLIILCWSEGQGSSIHDHAGSHCFMKVLQGKLSETQFSWPSKEDRKKAMKVIGTNTYERDKVTYINATRWKKEKDGHVIEAKKRSQMPRGAICPDVIKMTS